MEIDMLFVNTETNDGPIGQFLCYIQVILFKTTYSRRKEFHFAMLIYLYYKTNFFFLNKWVLVHFSLALTCALDFPTCSFLNKNCLFKLLTSIVSKSIYKNKLHVSAYRNQIIDEKYSYPTMLQTF